METIHNFRHLSSQAVPELQGTLHVMEHGPSGARLAWMDRVSDNKTFGIAFRTIPEDDTGVFHILEHSVLCGSEKYNVKEPFVELLKSSMQTFLNAMTYPDKTFYPVSSRNDKDFLNLMRVYLDAVLFPAIYRKPEIFHQEGWHYELREGADPVYKGVVFNEMKGAMASPDRLLYQELSKAMFPDSTYGYNSGGDPAHIPELTYDQFLNSHRRFYHPSNSYIILDGSVDLEAALEVMDREYLSRFTRQAVDSHIAWQAPVAPAPVTCHYEVSPNEALTGKARAGWAYYLGSFQDRRETFAMNALCRLLFGSNQSPLKQKILAAGLAENASMEVQDGTLQNLLVIGAENLDENRLEELEQLIRDSIAALTAGGLDHDHLKAILANMELRTRERDYGWMPQGLGIASDILDSWLYGGDPAANLSVGPLFEELNALVDTGWYEELLNRTILHNPHTARVLLLPSHTAGDEQRRAEKARLDAARAAWDEETLKQLRAEQETLDAWQSSADSPEDIAALPGLKLSDISPLPEDVPTALDAIGEIPLLRHDMAAGGISYVNLYFDASDLSEEELSQASLLCNALGKLGTASRSGLELQKQVSLLMGKLGFTIESHSRENQPESCRTFLCVSFSALDQKLSQAAELVKDILTATDFTAVSEINELLLQCRINGEQMVINAGNSVGMVRVLSGISAEGMVRECFSGFTALRYLKTHQAQELAPAMAALMEKLITTGRLTLSLTGTQNDGPLSALAAGLPQSRRETPVCALKPQGAKREGIVIPADISFAVAGGPLTYSGTMEVAAQIASLAHLWNAVRVQGGAYGTGMASAAQGCGMFYSYRDPKGAQSLKAFRATADFLRQFASGEPDLTGFIIGTISGNEPVLLPGRQGKAADGWYFRGQTFEHRCENRRAILSATPADLLAAADAIGAMTADLGVCVVGSQAQVDESGLDSVYTL